MLTDPPDHQTDDIDAIGALIESAVRHQNDPDALLALHVDDVVIVNIAGRRVMGRTEFGAVMRQALASPLADVTTTVDVEDIRFVRPDVALVSCTKHVHDAREGSAASAGSLPTVGTMSYVVEASDGVWRIALAHTTPVAS